MLMKQDGQHWLPIEATQEQIKKLHLSMVHQDTESFSEEQKTQQAITIHTLAEIHRFLQSMIVAYAMEQRGIQ